jgi:hypothetical protein
METLDGVDAAVMERARAVVGADQEIVQIWFPGDYNISQLQGATFCDVALNPRSSCPISWLCLPCCVMDVKSRLDTVMYVLTTTHIHVSLSTDNGTCGCADHINLRSNRQVGFTDSGSVPLENIVSVRHEAHGCGAGLDNSCDCCFSNHQEVKMQLSNPDPVVSSFWPVGNDPSVERLNAGNKSLPVSMQLEMIKKNLFIVVENSAEVAALIGELATARKQSVGDPHRFAAGVNNVNPVIMEHVVEAQVMEERKDPLEQIGKLKGLLDAGAITQAQFEEKRDALLASM